VTNTSACFTHDSRAAATFAQLRLILTVWVAIVPQPLQWVKALHSLRFARARGGRARVR
jgi:hypothetical protein